MKTLITYPYSTSLDSHLEIIDLALEPLFSELQFSSLSTKVHRCKTTIPCENLSLEIIDQSLILSSGSFSLEKQTLSNMNVQWNRDSSTLKLQLQTRHGSTIDIIAPAQQTTNFWNIIRAMDSGLSSKTIIQDEGEHVCACCKKREAFIEQATDKHPVALILQDVCETSDKMQFKLLDETNYTDLIINPVGYHFEHGFGKFLGDQEEQLEVSIASIHGIHLFRENIDNQCYSKLKLFNSFGKGFLEFSVLGDNQLHKWATLLDSMQQYQKSYSES